MPHRLGHCANMWSSSALLLFYTETNTHTYWATCTHLGRATTIHTRTHTVTHRKMQKMIDLKAYDVWHMSCVCVCVCACVCVCTAQAHTSHHASHPPTYPSTQRPALCKQIGYAVIVNIPCPLPTHSYSQHNERAAPMRSVVESFLRYWEPGEEPGQQTAHRVNNCTSRHRMKNRGYKDSGNGYGWRCWCECVWPLFQRQQQLNLPRLSAARLGWFPARRVSILKKYLFDVGRSALGFNPWRRDSQEIGSRLFPDSHEKSYDGKQEII